MERYVCIHGHFYQPPRENPWLEDVEMQDSAYPYHDWNDRITDECYRQNAVSRILSPDRKIVDIANNYIRMSFNFGPTLFRWFEMHAPKLYQAIQEADRDSRERFSGHGSALAQCYNHMIMPLANERDRETQVIWAIEDFKYRFGREPEGMWLPETAADTASLEVLAHHGIRFTVLAPRQARRVRREGDKNWTDLENGTVDTSVPYRCTLPSGHEIALFFYNGDISQDLAYGGLLHNGEAFAKRMLAAFPAKDGEPARLVHTATDGETFGHHHRNGDMALAYCFHYLENSGEVTLTNYAEFLEKFPPRHEVEIWDNSSWSCVHGVERWRSNCGCSADPALSGQQDWRAPLRHALDWLRDQFAPFYEKTIASYDGDPWDVRNRYIHVINNREHDNVTAFLNSIAGGDLDDRERTNLLSALEMQRNAMLMYTSCGWFFDRISGIENVQVLLYASRACQLCQAAGGPDLEPEFRRLLAEAPTHERRLKNGADVYQTYVQPSRVSLDRVAAQYALRSLFEEDPTAGSSIYAFNICISDGHREKAGIQTLVTCRTSVRSNITCSQQDFDVAALHMGGHNLFATVGKQMGRRKFQNLCKRLQDAFSRGDIHETMRLMNVAFEGRDFSITDLFRDEQRRILDRVLASAWREIESSYRHIFERNYATMLMMRNMNIPLPPGLAAPSEFVLNLEFRRCLSSDQPEIDALRELVDDTERLSLKLDHDMIRYEGARKVDRMLDRIKSTPEDPEILANLDGLIAVIFELSPEIVLQDAQNVFFTLAREQYPSMKTKAQAGEQSAQHWVEHFERLAQLLDLAVS